MRWKWGWPSLPSLFLLWVWGCSSAPPAAPPVVALELSPGLPAVVAESSRDANAVSKARAPGTLVWESVEADAREKARRERLPMLVYLRAEWAAACAEMERGTWRDARVGERARSFVLLKIDVSAADLEGDLYAERYGARAIPSIAAFDAEGRRAAVLSGYADAETLLRLMDGLMDSSGADGGD